jgi:hypothetical protein
MGKGFKHGTSGKKENPLNFQVKTYPSETELKADVPQMTTIGVLTTTTMNSWVISPNEPTSPEVGMVWIKIDESGDYGFNALNENEIYLVPVGAKQYESGAWADKPSYCYIDDEWKLGDVVVDELLYDVGNQYTEVTGGWGSLGWASGYAQYSVSAPYINASGITLKGAGSSKLTVAGTAKKIDLSKVKTLYVNVGNYGLANTYEYAYFGVNHEKKVCPDGMGYKMTASVKLTGTGEVALDVSSVNEGYVVAFVYSNVSSVVITKIRME